ncbi:MAG: hypothetical protein EP344_12235 [Bacteroidetes bacterium]|nr:MAG: hypothetical protein EP344_12235 [Bacteroidota bacterium]
MSSTNAIEGIKKELQAQLVEDIAAALKAFQELLSEQSEKHTIVVSLLARLNSANKEKLLGTLSNDELQLEYNKIRAAMLELIEDLEEADLGMAQPAGTKGSAAPRQGSILYRIPNTMPVKKPTKCVIRISIREDAIVENITIDDQVQLKQLYKVSETMEAEIVDPTGGKVFEISTVSEKVQLIDEEGYTEWWYYVTPQQEGSYPLVLKISIIELVNGQPSSKELVMEEVVDIVTDGPVSDSDEIGMKKAGIALAFPPLVAIGGGAGAAELPQAEGAQATQSGAAAKSAGAAKWTLVQKVAAVIGVVATGAAGTWLLTSECTRDWWKAEYLDKNQEGYERFIAKHDERCPYYDPAVYKKMQFEDTPAGYRSYLYEFSQGQFRDEARQALARLERDALEDFKRAPSADKLHRFMNTFPDCSDLDGVLEIVEQDSALREDYLPLIEQRLEECKKPAPPDEAPDSQLPLPVLEVEQPDTVGPVEKPVVETTPPKSHPTPTAAMPDYMIRIRGGVFPMGTENGMPDEKPVRNVQVSSFYLSKHEVTFDEYDRFCAETNRAKPDDEGWGRGDRPVIHVSWLDAAAYCNWLSQQNGLPQVYSIRPDGSVKINASANGFRLPTEAEWEYAARCNKPHLYSGSDDLNEVAWYLENSGNMTNPVEHKTPNACGLYDMTGNVREWCHDNYGSYSLGDTDNPVGPPIARKRVVRGGPWGRNPLQQRITYRNSAIPGYQDNLTGFRVALR